MISIIVPVYNTEKYLRRCIDSVLNGTYKDFELILVNDGSVDNSGKICNEYSLKDNRIKVVHLKNTGVSNARNVGLELAKGDYIGFLDSDDFIKENMYEFLLTELLDKNVDISGCFFNFLNLENRLVCKITEEEKQFAKVYNGKEFCELLYSKSYFNVLFVSVWNKLYRKEVFKNIRFEQSYAEDEQIMVKLVLDKTISISDKMLYIYTQNLSSLTNLKFSEKNLIFIDILEERLKIFKKEDMKDLYFKTLKLYINIFIEYNFKAKENQVHFNFSKFKNLVYKLIMLNINFKKNITRRELIKLNVRVLLFLLAPKLYELNLNKRKRYA